MSKEQPLIFWTSFGVLSVIALGLLGWTYAGVADYATVKADQKALVQRIETMERSQGEITEIKTDIAVIKSEMRLIRRSVENREE